MTDASEMVDTDLAEEMNGIIPEEPQEFRHATSLDSALQHLIPTLQSHKGLFILYSEPAVIDALVARQHNIMSIPNPVTAANLVCSFSSIYCSFFSFSFCFSFKERHLFLQC